MDPGTRTVNVTNFHDPGTVFVIDEATGTVTHTITAGYFPWAVAVDPAARTVYVANELGGTVSVIDGATSTVTATIPVGSYPDAVAVDPGTHTASVTNYSSNTVSVIGGCPC